MAKPKSFKSKKGKNVDNENDNEEERRKNDLIKRASCLSEELRREESATVDFRQQLEKVKHFWGIEKQRLETKKAELSERNDKLQKIKESHRDEINNYKQKLKHLLFEQQNEITQHKTNVEIALKFNEDHYKIEGEELKNDKRFLNKQLKEKELSHQIFLIHLKETHDEAVSELQKEFVRKSRDIITHGENVMKKRREELEMKRKNDILTIEKMKSEQSRQMGKVHEQELKEMRKYYNSIIETNLNRITSLKESVQSMKTTERQIEKSFQEAKSHNKQIHDPLSTAKTEIQDLTQALDVYHTEKQELNRAKEDLTQMETKLENLKWNHEVLFQRYQALEREAIDYQDKMENTIAEAQQRTNFHNVVLEQKIHSLHSNIEKHTATVAEILSGSGRGAMNLEESSAARLANVIECKDAQILELESVLQQIKLKHKDVLSRVEKEWKVEVDSCLQ